jgi:hypothetical protein
MRRIPFLLAFAALFLAVSDASAASSVERFWVGFKSFWGGVFGSIGGIVGTALLIGAASVFILTRGKWLK